MDFPTAWAMMAATSLDEHAERCSYRTQNRALLCDCPVLQRVEDTQKLLATRDYVMGVYELWRNR